MKIVNLTPHAVTVYGPKGETKVIPASGQVVRCEVDRIFTGKYIDGVPVNKTVFGAVRDMPEPQEEVYYLVSVACAQSLAEEGRTADIIITDEAVRSPEGRMVGCRAFVQLQKPA